MMDSINGYALRCDVCGVISPVVKSTIANQGKLRAEVETAAKAEGWDVGKLHTCRSHCPAPKSVT